MTHRQCLQVEAIMPCKRVIEQLRLFRGIGFLLRHYGIIRTDTTQHINQINNGSGCKPGRLLQPQNLRPRKPVVFRKERH